MSGFRRASSKFKLAARLLLVPLTAIFLGEMAVMVFIDHLLHSGMPYWLVTFVDAASLTVISVPLLWMFLLRPLLRTYSTEADTAHASAQALVDATMETAILADAEGRVLAINQVGAQRFNMTPEQMLGGNIYAFMPDEVARERRARIGAILHNGTPSYFEDQRDGRHFATSVYPVMDEHGTAIRFAVFANDITERVQLQGIDALLHACDQRLLRGDHPEELLRFICNEAVQLFGLCLAWVGRKETNGQVTIAACGGTCGYAESLRRIGVRWDDTAEGRGPVGAAIRTGQVQVSRVTDSQFQPWRAAAEQHGFQAVMAIPLITRGEIYGVFTLYSGQSISFDVPVTVKRLTEVAGRISVLLEMAMDQQQLRLLSVALTSAGNAVFIADRGGRITWANPAFSRLSGYSAEELIGQNPRLLKSGRQDEAYYRQLWEIILSGEVWSQETVEQRKDGRLYTVMQTITPIRDATGEVSHFVSIQEDISARKLTDERIRHMAHYDALTDLPNRALFYDRLYQAVAFAKREAQQMALLFIDLDRFKAINDELGHAVGDLLLQSVAERLRACVRESDTLARLAGDEFTVILPRVESEQDAQAVAEKILSALSAPYSLEGHEVLAGASIGIAFCPRDAEDADGLVKCADAAMYAVKAQGRNAWRQYRAEINEISADTLAAS
ncbi:MAG: diguanylate cyclase [Gammaproteobacteria bacterium]|nr:diguanylate cyclase [Gammaproteobacteria bacterium]